MVDEKNPILNPQAEGSNVASGSSSFRTVIEEEKDSEEEILSSDYDSDSDYSSDEEISEINNKIIGLIEEYKKLELEEEKQRKEIREWENPTIWKKTKTEWQEKNIKEANDREEKRKEIIRIMKEYEQTKEKRKRIIKLSASTSTGKEVIKAEISQELIEAKEIFANFQISETTQEEIKSKISKHVDRMKNIWDGGNTFANAIGFVPILGNIVGPIHVAEHSNCLEKNLKKQAKENLPAVVNKLITKATADLEKQKKKVLKKMDALIENREKEVNKAKKVIEALEIVNQELAHKNKDLREKNKELIVKHEINVRNLQEKSDEEINTLQEEIRKVVNQLKDYQEREKRLKEERARKLTKEHIQKVKISEKDIKATMVNPEDRIKELESELEEMRFTAITFKESEEKRASELKDEQERHETTKTNLNNEIKRKEEEHNVEKNLLNSEIVRKESELERERKIFLDQQKKLNDEIRDWEAKHKKIADEKHEIDLENTDLKAENKILKDKRKELETEVEKWKDEYEREKALHQPTWIQSQLKFFGIDKFRNSLATATAIIGLAGIIYATSLVWKYWIKPAYRNFKGEPKRKGKVRYDDYEEVEENEEKQPTIIIQNSTPAEKTDQQEKKKNKKKIKGDSS